MRLMKKYLSGFMDSARFMLLGFGSHPTALGTHCGSLQSTRTTNVEATQATG